MKKINKICIVVLLLILCCACGRPRGLSSRIGRHVNCESELGDFSKYLKLDKLSTTEDGKCECNKIRVNFQTIGITCGNMFTVTSEGTDLYTTYRMINATATLEDTIEYGRYTVNIKYYLYEDISIIDSDSEETKEVEISGLAAQYNIKIDDKYLSGLEHGFDLDKRYDNFDELPKEYLEKMNLLITEQLDTYTNLKTI